MKDLSELRCDIDAVDAEIVRLFCRRMSLCCEIARVKQENGIQTKDEARQQAVLSRVREMAGEENAADAEALYRRIFWLSCARQERERKRPPEPADGEENA